MERRQPLFNSLSDRNVDNEMYCRKYRRRVNIPCTIDDVYCDDKCLEKTDDLKCRSLYWGEYVDLRIGPEQMIYSDICEELTSKIKTVENENDSIVYHGSILLLYFMNRILSDKFVIRVLDEDTNFPFVKNITTPITKSWYEDIYPQLIHMSNWKDFWNIILTSQPIRQRMISNQYPDNWSFMKDFLLSTSLTLGSTTVGETAGYFIFGLAKQPINNVYPIRILTDVFNYYQSHYLIQNKHGQRIKLDDFLNVMKQLKELLNARSHNELDKIKLIATSFFQISNFDWSLLNYKPACLQSYNYDWVLYQIILDPNFIQNWTYLSVFGGRPHPIMYETSFNLVDFLQQCRHNVLDIDSIQLRLILNPSLLTDTHIIPYSALTIDIHFNTLIEQIISSLKQNWIKIPLS